MSRINSSSQLNNHAQIAMQFSDTEDSKKMDLPAKILVVEDEPISQHIAKFALEMRGYQVDIVGTGEKALALYQTSYYDLILMDMGLPDITGIDVTCKIREIEQSTGKHIPIIALTAHGDFAKQHCLSAGMDDFTTKPFEFAQIDNIIKKWIKKSQNS
jgi:CheY-like chemotaxis protein